MLAKMYPTASCKGIGLSPSLLQEVACARYVGVLHSSTVQQDMDVQTPNTDVVLILEAQTVSASSNWKTTNQTSCFRTGLFILFDTCVPSTDFRSLLENPSLCEFVTAYHEPRSYKRYCDLDLTYILCPSLPLSLSLKIAVRRCNRTSLGYPLKRLVSCSVFRNCGSSHCTIVLFYA